MSQNIKIIKINNLENDSFEERNIGVDANNVDYKESTIDLVLEEIEQDISTINTSLEKTTENLLYCSNQDFEIGTNAIPQNIQVPEGFINAVASYDTIQKAFRNTLGKNNILREQESIPSITNTNVYPNPYENQVVSTLFLRENFYYKEGKIPGKYTEIKIVKENYIINIPSGEIISEELFTVVENSKLNSLEEKEITVAEASLYIEEEINIGEKVKVYLIQYSSPALPSSAPPIIKFIDRENAIIDFDIKNKPEGNLLIYSAESLYKQNQILLKYLEDIYQQLNELKTQ